MTTAIFAGSFDPFTNGHLDLALRAANFCNEVIIGIGYNPAKKTLFSLDERHLFIKKSLLDSSLKTTYRIESYSGLLVDFAKEHQAQLLIRGIRSASDFEYEMGLAQINKKLAPEIETILLPADPNLSLISSSMIKELARHNSEIISHYCSDTVVKALELKFRV